MGQETLRKNRGPSALDRYALLLAGGLIAVAALCAYANSFSGPFIFDDGFAIEKNPSIRQLWPLSGPLSPPPEMTVGGRPILNLSFALNYAFSGIEVGSYHALNLLIHILAGLTLFGLSRRTLLRPVLRERFAGDAIPLATAIALLWVVHPVQTESVTYLSQRAESLMSLFYLVTLYSFLRAAELPGRKTAWSILCVIACLLGMGAKEVMVTAPAMVLLYDRTFVAGTFREAWRQRWPLHSCLMATWLPLGWLLLDVAKRSVGLGLGVSPWNYALTQAGAIVHYLALAVWPDPLVIDYGTQLVTDPLQVWPQVLLVLALLAATGWALARKPVLGFLGAWFFLILAPTSSFIPLVLDPVTEHRLYLPLAAVITLGVLVIYRFLGRNGGFIVAALAFVFILLTFLRNEDYQSPLDLWAQTTAAAPDNARAHNNYGELLLQADRPVEAISQFEAAVRLRADYPEVHNNWGNALVQLGQLDDAIRHYQKALRLDPHSAPSHNNWGNVLSQQGKMAEALGQYAEAVRLDPNYTEAHYNFALALARSGQKEKALDEFRDAQRCDPGSLDVEKSWGSLLAGMGRFPEAAEHFQRAVQLGPGDPESHNDLGVVLVQMGRRDEALSEFRTALQLDPNYTPAARNLAQMKAP